jgi:hypothetical protein
VNARPSTSKHRRSVALARGVLAFEAILRDERQGV